MRREPALSATGSRQQPVVHGVDPVGGGLRAVERDERRRHGPPTLPGSREPLHDRVAEPGGVLGAVPGASAIG